MGQRRKCPYNAIEVLLRHIAPDTLEDPPICASLPRCCVDIDMLPFVFPFVVGLGAGAPELFGGCDDIAEIWQIILGRVKICLHAW